MGMDALYQFSPDSVGRPGIVEKKFKAEDKFSKLILNEITALPSELHIDEFIFTNDKKTYEKFFGGIINLTESLMKANSNLKEYKSKEKVFEKKFRRQLYKDPNKKSFDIREDPIELKTQFDSFLAQIKASLDNLAFILNPLLNSKFDRWAKAKNKNGIEKSGIKILNFLKNMPKNPITNLLIDHIEKNIEWISYLVSLRDKPLHKGKNEKLEGFIYVHSDKIILNPRIFHPNGASEDIRNFMNKTLEEITQFISATILLSIQRNAPKGLSLSKTLTERGDTQYQWSVSPISK